jgi:hypothetical protein
MTTPSVTDSVGEGVSGDSQTTFETATLTPSGTDRYLLALVSSSAGVAVDVSAVKFGSTGGTGGQSMTLLSAQEDHHQNGRMSLWGLLAPAASAGTMWAQWSSVQDERIITAVTFQDVDQGTPLGTDVYGNGTSAAGVLVAGSTSETRGWVISGSPSADMKWGMFGVALKQSGGGGGDPLPIFTRTTLAAVGRAGNF